MPSSTKMESQSVKILEFLKFLPNDATFTSSSIYDELASVGVSLGAITGFLSVLKMKGAITISGAASGPTGKQYEIYRVVDLSDITTRNNNAAGGKIGRNMDGTTKKEKLVELLMHVAGELDNMVVKSNIKDFTTEELLKELGRRTKAPTLTAVTLPAKSY